MRECLYHRLHIVATAYFWRTFHHDGKLALAGEGGGVTGYPPFTISTNDAIWSLQSRTELWCTRQLRGQILYTPHIYTHIWSLCVRSTSMTGNWSRISAKSRLFGAQSRIWSWKVTVSASQLSPRIRPLVLRGSEWKDLGNSFWRTAGRQEEFS